MKAEEIIKHISEYLIKEVGCGLSELIESYDTTFVEEHILDAVQSLLQQREEAERGANDLIWKIERYCDALNKSSNEPKILEMIQDYKSKKG